MSSAEVPRGDVIVDTPQPCAKCGDAAHIIVRDKRRLCAHCYREERTQEPPAA